MDGVNMMDVGTTDLTQLAAAAVIPTIIGLVALLRNIPGFPTWLAPLCAVGFGVLAAVGFEAGTPAHSGAEWVQAVLNGAGIGLASAGLYSGTRTVLQAGQAPHDAPLPPRS